MLSSAYLLPEFYPALNLQAGGVTSWFHASPRHRHALLQKAEPRHADSQQGHSLACPGTRHQRKTASNCAGHESWLQSGSALRHPRASKAADTLVVLWRACDRPGLSPALISHWPTRYFGRWRALPSSPCRPPSVSDRLMYFGFASEPFAPSPLDGRCRRAAQSQTSTKSIQIESLPDLQHRDAGHPVLSPESIVFALDSRCEDLLWGFLFFFGCC